MLPMNVQVALLGGHALELESLLPSFTVQDLKTEAQRAFGQRHLILITADKRVLVNPEETLEEAEIQNGECITAMVAKPELAATERAFALWCHGDSAIVTWGHEGHGGDSSAVQDQLRGVTQIQATLCDRQLLLICFVTSIGRIIFVISSWMLGGNRKDGFLGKVKCLRARFGQEMLRPKAVPALRLFLPFGHLQD